MTTVEISIGDKLTELSIRRLTDRAKRLGLEMTEETVKESEYQGHHIPSDFRGDLHLVRISGTPLFGCETVVSQRGQTYIEDFSREQSGFCTREAAAIGLYKTRRTSRSTRIPSFTRDNSVDSVAVLYVNPKYDFSVSDLRDLARFLFE